MRKLWEVLFAAISDALIARAVRTPYFHLEGYMERFWLFRPRWWTFFCGARVHHILRSDFDRHLHDHPWPFITVILKGGYFEERPLFRDYPASLTHEPTVIHWHGPGSVLLRSARARHRLSLPQHRSTWTLFISGPRSQSWGFYTKAGKVHWSEYMVPAEALRQRDQLAIHHGAE